MLSRIRGARVSRKTAWIVLGLAVIVWAIVTYVRIRDFVPEELRTENPETRP